MIVRNLNGDVRVEAGSGRSVVIDARKSWRRGDPSKVRIEAGTVGNGDVLACALWNENATCDENGYDNRSRRGRNNDSNDVSVEFIVRVPDGVRLDINTVNGDLRISGATAEVAAHTVNGSIESDFPLTVSGRISPRRVNATVGNGGRRLSFKSVNGSIKLRQGGS